jgi:UDP-N-acetylmuramoyl-tripeptide--D-alanyl-D-alanine ligase
VITLRFDQLAAMSGGQLRTPDLGQRTFSGVSTDSRTIAAGQLFFAIRGERNDGHQFVEQVIARGAAGVVIDRDYGRSKTLPTTVAVIEVENTHAAMVRLAGEYLATLPARRLGITGSNGKTTTKEFTYRLLEAFDGNVYRSPGNFNNLFGIPLALFAMPEQTRWAVLEMGISVPGEMDRLASLVKPHLLAVTNVGPTHLEFLGTVEAVAREKLSALQYATPDAPLIVNADDPVLMVEVKRVHLRPTTYAVHGEADFRPQAVDPTEGGLLVTIEGHRFRLPLFGQYQVYNLLAAYAIARAVGCDFDQIDTLSLPLSTAAMRGEIVTAGGLTFVADCYNANPESVKAGLNSFAQYPSSGRKVVILGDMLELGETSAAFHREVGCALGSYSFDLILMVGPMSRYAVETAQSSGVKAERLHHFTDATLCALAASQMLLPGDLVYLKGSRGVGLEVVLKRFVAEGKES